MRMSPSTAISLAALFLSLGSVGYAANGGAFILGVFNSATQLTALVANFNGSALQVANTSAAASAVPLQLTAAAGHPPMKVNTTTKVANLNADYVDGIDASTQLTRVMRVPFNLAPSATSAPITVPAGVPVELVGVVSGDLGKGVGHASLLSAGGSIGWVGLSSNDNAAITQGNSATAGTAIVGIGFHSFIVVQVAGPTTIRIYNNNVYSAVGSVTLMW